MKQRIILSFLLMFAILFLRPDGAMAGPTVTRASNLGAIAIGLGKGMHMEDFLKENPSCRTAILSYAKLDSNDVYSLVSNMRINAQIQEKMQREFWPQLALETGSMNLHVFCEELSHRGTQVDLSVRTLAREIARYRDKKKWYFIRPFSEMNDSTEPWEFSYKPHPNSPQDLANAWILLRDTFDQEGATNAIFIFSPLAAYRVHGEKEILDALKRIPMGYIDAFGLNVYSRPKSAYGGTSPDPISFAELVQPWIKLVKGTRHRDIPLAVAEMGVSNQAPDEARARWLKATFEYAKSNGFVMITYYNYPHKYWQIDEQTLAGQALKAGMNPN